jgi:hypothetical protein
MGFRAWMRLVVFLLSRGRRHQISRVAIRSPRTYRLGNSAGHHRLSSPEVTGNHVIGSTLIFCRNGRRHLARCGANRCVYVRIADNVKHAMQKMSCKFM